MKGSPSSTVRDKVSQNTSESPVTETQGLSPPWSTRTHAAKPTASGGLHAVALRFRSRPSTGLLHHQQRERVQRWRSVLQRRTSWCLLGCGLASSGSGHRAGSHTDHARKRGLPPDSPPGGGSCIRRRPGVRVGDAHDRVWQDEPTSSGSRHPSSCSPRGYGPDPDATLSADIICRGLPRDPCRVSESDFQN